MKTRQVAGLIFSLGILIGMFFVPVPMGLTEAGRNTIGLTLSFLILLMTEVLPSAVICLLATALMPLLGVTGKFGESIGGYSHPVIFFIIASFGISAGFTNVPLSKRILVKLLKKFGRDVKTMLLSMMICAALVSSLISNIPTTAIFMAIGIGFLNMYEDETKRKQTGRAFMIAIPVASMIGGMMTPAGSSLNLLAIGLLESLSGETITFVQWMFVGIPLTAILIPFAWFVIVKVYKPTEMDAGKVIKYIDSLHVPKQIERKEMMVIAITLGMLFFWILSSWVRSIEVYTVAVLGCCLLFMPGIEVLTWESFTKSISWEVIFITGTVLSMGNAIASHKVSVWLVESLYPADLLLSASGIVAVVAVFTFLMLILIPIAPALITVLAGPLITVAAAQGYPPVLLLFTLGLCASNCYLFPIDSVPLLTYGTGYYSMTDMPKSTAMIQAFMVIVVAVWLPVAARIIGMV